jgi:tryptophan-rich sensory protein
MSKLLLIFSPLLGGLLVGSTARTDVSNPPPPRPKNSPPDWVFGPVWTVLYLMMGYASYIVFKKTGRVPPVYWLQLALNLLWVPVYFKKKDTGLAFKIIVALWLSILVTITEFNKIDPFAGKLLTPYLGWVTFATYLNYQNKDWAVSNKLL